MRQTVSASVRGHHGSALPLVLRGDARAVSWAPSSLPEADDDTVERLMRMYQDDEALGMALSDAEALGIAQSDLGHSVFPESVMIPMMMGLIKA